MLTSTEQQGNREGNRRKVQDIGGISKEQKIRSTRQIGDD